MNNPRTPEPFKDLRWHAISVVLTGLLIWFAARHWQEDLERLETERRDRLALEQRLKKREEQLDGALAHISKIENGERDRGEPGHPAGE